MSMTIPAAVADLPDDVHAKLAERAQARGLPLPEYLRAVLVTAAETPTISELAARIAARRPIVLSEPTESTVRQIRDATG